MSINIALVSVELSKPRVSGQDLFLPSLSVVQQDPRKDFPLGDSSSLLVTLPCLRPGDGDLSRGLACHMAHFCPGRFLEQCSVSVEVTVVHLAGSEIFVWFA